MHVAHVTAHFYVYFMHDYVAKTAKTDTYIDAMENPISSCYFVENVRISNLDKVL